MPVWLAVSLQKIQIERKMHDQNQSQMTKKHQWLARWFAVSYLHWIHRGKIGGLDQADARRSIFISPETARNSRQALGGANDDKFMQLRRRRRTFAWRCAPPWLKYFWWWRKRISSELSCLLISHLGEIKEWCCLYRREQTGFRKMNLQANKNDYYIGKQNESRQNIQRIDS